MTTVEWPFSHNPWTEVTLWDGRERIQLAQLNISGGRRRERFSMKHITKSASSTGAFRLRRPTAYMRNKMNHQIGLACSKEDERMR